MGAKNVSIRWAVRCSVAIGFSAITLMMASCVATQQSSVRITSLPDGSSSGATVHGTIVDTSSKPLFGVVIILEKEGKMTQHAVADTNGVFSISGLTPGTYAIRVLCPFCVPPEPKELSIANNQNVQVEYILAQDIPHGPMCVLEPKREPLKGTETGIVVYEDENGVLHIENK